MDFQRIKKQLETLGYRAVNIEEMPTCKGIAASWQVMFRDELVAHCFDTGEGGCLSVQWSNRAHCLTLRRAGKGLCDREPVESALIALSLRGTCS